MGMAIRAGSPSWVWLLGNFKIYFFQGMAFHYLGMAFSVRGHWGQLLVPTPVTPGSARVGRGHILDMTRDCRIWAKMPTKSWRLLDASMFFT